MSESGKQGRPRRRRGRLLVHLFTLALLGVGLLSVGAVTGLAADATISTSGSIGAYSWSPSEATVNAGGTVEFKNMNGSHAVAWEPSNPETPTCPGVPSAGSASWSGTCTFQAGGTYKFYCPVHPTEMKGTITVNGPSTPVATTGTATAVSDTGATLNGSVNPNGQATSYYFEYGTSTAYGTKTTEEALGEGTAPIAKSAAVSGLTPSTTYHFRIVAKYGGSATKPGEDRTFSTTGPPSATTEPATGVGGSEATLAGTVNARGIETKYFFEYGTNGAFGQKTAEKVATGTSNVAASAKVTGLSVNTAYQFRLVAKSTSGESKGVDLTFTTRGPPKAITGAASGVGNTAATLAGVVNPEGQQTAYFFEYGTSEAYGQKTPEAAAGKGTGDVSVSTAIADLAPGTPYHFKLVAKSSAGTTSGTDQTFTTSSTPPPPPPPAEESSPPPPPPPPGAAPPDTRITKKPTAKTRDRTPTVKFAATVAGASYLCSVDSKPFKACRSPFTAPSLRPGRHRIRVKAVAGGAADPTPAACSFKVLGKKR